MIGLIIFTSVSCDLSVSLGEGDLKIYLDNSSRNSSLTWLPNIDMEINSYTFRGSGPTAENSFIVEGFTGLTFSKTALAAGDWEITIEGYNEAGTLVGTETIQITIQKDEETTATATLEPLSGIGELELSVQWTDSENRLQDPQVWVTINDSNGESIEGVSTPVQLENSGQSAFKTIENLPSRWYEVTVALYDGTTEDLKVLEWEGVYSCRIVAEESTPGNVTIPENEIDFGTGRASFLLEREMQDPFTISLTASQEVVRTGNSVTFSAEGSYNPTSAQFRWYVDGKKKIGETSETFTYTFDEGGAHTVSLFVEDNGVLIGSKKSFEIKSIQSIGSGGIHTFLLIDDGTIMTTGNNEKGQLGLGESFESTESISNFTYVPEITDVKAVSAGFKHSIILKNNGTIWATGQNDKGQLGLGNTIDQMTFTQVPDISGVKAISVGSDFTIIIKEDGTLWATGNNEYGQLGLGNTTDQTTFTQIIGISNVKAVSAKYGFTMILKEDGTVWATGKNENGQLGLGNTIDQTTFTQVQSISNVEAISVGSAFTMALKEDGTLWATGDNAKGQFGLGNTTNSITFIQIPSISDVKAISNGNHFSAILKDDGTVWVTGDNVYGALGLGDISNRYTFTKVSLSDVKEINAKGYRFMILKEDGTLWAAGYTLYGQLGFESDDMRQKVYIEVNY
jgi:alpha-tubulin suppressor-like RCC1 family protein